MSKVKKIVTILVIILLFAGLAIGGIFAIIKNNGGNSGDIQRTEKLSVPKNLVINDEWVLHWDAVSGAMQYKIYMDSGLESERELVAKVNSLSVSEYAILGQHTFSVQAIYYVSSFNSDVSAQISKTKTTKLHTPSWATLNDKVFSWNPVNSATSYMFEISANGQEVAEQTLTTTEFDLSSYIASHPTVNHITVRVKAVSTNSYILESDYSTTKDYYKITDINTPSLNANFTTSTNKGDSRVISWAVDEYVEKYQVYVDEDLVTTITKDDMSNLSTYTVDLSNFKKSDVVGEHIVYITAVPVELDGLKLEPKESNKIKYAVNQKLGSVSVESINITMSGLNLTTSWESVPLASTYTIYLQGYDETTSEYSIFKKASEITSTNFTLTLSKDFGYKKVRAQVQACADPKQTYLKDDDFSPNRYSADFSVVTKLPTVSGLEVTEKNGNLIVSWQEDEALTSLKEYVSEYFVRVCYATFENGVYTKEQRVARDSKVSKDIKSFSISELLKNYDAGAYSVAMTTLRSDEYENLFESSEATSDKFFTYKAQLSSPVVINCVRNYSNSGESTLKFSFYGVKDATGYSLTIFNSEGENLGSTTIAQPTNYLNEVIVDEEFVQSVLGNASKPSSYKFNLMALAPTDEGTKIANSSVVEYNYNDMFKHKAVAGVSFTQNGNSVTISWEEVDTANEYEGWVNDFRFTTNSTSYTTENWTLGDNVVKISCMEIPTKYTKSDEVKAKYSYIYTITGTADISKALYQDESGTQYIELSIPHFDSKITGYAIQIGDNAPQKMTIDTENKKVYYRATMLGENAEFSLYEKKNVQIFAGSCLNGDKVDRQDYIKEIVTIQSEITNDLLITAPILSIDNKHTFVTMNLEEKAIPFTKKVEYTISSAGRVLYNGTLTGNITAEVNLNLATILKGDSTAVLDVGSYSVNAVIYSISGVTAEATTLSFEYRDKLDSVSGFTPADDKSYLQWNAVDDADDYTISVTHNGNAVSGVALRWSEYISGENLVIRLDTIDLFSSYGAGEYVFTVTATCQEEYITNAEPSEYKWALATTLVAPTFSVEVYSGTDTALSGKVCAKILKNALASHYIVAVDNGEAKTIEKDSTGDIYQYVDLGLSLAGKYTISVQAMRQSSGEVSEATKVEYINVIASNSPQNATAEQDLTERTITFSSDLVNAKFTNNGTVTENIPLTIEVSISTLNNDYCTINGSQWFTLANEDKATKVFNLADSGEVAGIKEWFAQNTESMFLVRFRTQAYTNSAISSKPILTESVITLVRFAYQRQLETPTFEFSNTKVTPTENAVMTVTSLDSNANNSIDLEITDSDNNSRILSAKSLDSGTKKFKITADMLGNTRGTYSVRIRATSNGIFATSLWSDSKEITCATALDSVTNIQFTKNTSENKFSLSFDAINDSSAGTITYSATLKALDTSGTEQTIDNLGTATISGKRVSFNFDYSENEGLKTILNNAGSVLNFVITATPETSDLCLASDTSFVYTIGQIGAPQNFVFTPYTNGVVGVKWTSDRQYSDYTSTYTYEVIITDNSGGVVESNLNQTITSKETPEVMFELLSDYKTTAYLVEFRITKITATKGTDTAYFTGSTEKTATNYCGAYYINSVSTGTATFDVTYDKTTKTYTGSITHTTNNGKLFNGQTYEVTIAGVVVASGLTTLEFSLESGVVANLIAISKGQSASYTIKISDAVFTYGDKQIVAYQGKNYAQNVTLPLVVTNKPTAVTLNQDNATALITNIPYVTQYAWRIFAENDTKNTLEGTVDSGNGSLSTTANLIGFTQLLAGKYTLYVKANSVESAKIYADDAEEFALEFTRTLAMEKVENAKFETKGNGYGDFATTVSWTYTKDFDKTQFAVKFVSISTGTEYAVDWNYADLTSSNTNYELVFAGLDLINNTDLGYDLTRGMPAGDYKIIIQVLGANNYYTTSESVEIGTYQNKFGVVAVDSNAFAVAPECFFGESNMVNGELVFGENEATNKANLEAYIQKFGFNSKYLVITQTGAKQNRATGFNLVVNGTNFGLIDKTSTIVTFDFDSISSANKVRLGDCWQAGANEISLMPYTTDEMLDYYFYVEGETEYALNSDTAKAKLNTTFTMNMYKKFSTPNDPRVELGYSDSAKHNVNKANVTIANSATESVYSVKIWYKDYYDNTNTDTLLVSYEKSVTSVADGFSIFDEIKALGPHEFWCEIKQIGLKDKDSKCFIFSDTALTSSFVYTTAMSEFGNVTEITDTNATEDTPNGTLVWALPTNAYDMVAQYNVTLKDKNGNTATKTAKISLTVSVEGIKYEFKQNDNNLFTIKNGTIRFDMTKFFTNDSAGLSNGTRSTPYIAGEYSYKITAVALDKNGNVAEGRIFDPENNEYGFKTYVYKGIAYPLKPYDVEIDSANVLTWKYYSETEDIYSTSKAQFKIVIYNYTIEGRKTIKTYRLTTPTTLEKYEIDLTDYLVAGGSYTNDVFVCRISPDTSYYLDSELSLAKFATDYKNAQMPSIAVNWTEKDSISYSITDTEKVTKLQKELNSNGLNATFKISLLRVSQQTANELDENATFDTIIDSEKKNVQVEFDEVEYNNATNYQFNLISAIKEKGVSADWLSGENFIAGRYFVKVEFATSHKYFESSIAYTYRDIKSVWAVASEDEVKLTGAYLTTKTKNATTYNVSGQDDRNWADASYREAVLSFNVYAIKDFNSVAHWPSSVSVRIGLWNGTSYDTQNTIIYKLPTYTSSVSENCEISKVSGVADCYNVRIDLHDFFDNLKIAGAYSLEFRIDEDEYGEASESKDGSDWYTYSYDICHFIALPTPILDYRLGITETDSGYKYVLNWALTPNKNTYEVDTETEYNVNIYAFKQNSSGVYGCDSAYSKLSSDNKQLFLQKETANSNQTSTYGFVLGKLIRDASTTVIDDRICYVNESTTSGLVLEPNSTYKFFMYLSNNASKSNDPNAKFYINSLTSEPQEYIYKVISAQHYGTEVTSKIDDVYVVENQENFLDAQVYDITSHQDSNNYNNGFELFIYDTQDVNAGTNASWTKNQEENGTYLAHYIITTLNNVASSGRAVPLYVVDSENYVEGKNQPLTYLRNSNGSLRQIGVLQNSQITINGFTLGELLGEERAFTPITYYCKMKAWINNDEVNANVFTVNGEVDSAKTNIYSTEWVKKNITNDDTTANAYVSKLEEQNLTRTVELADFNSLNPSFYFTFQHTIRFATPSISKVELINNDGESDVVNDCVVDFSTGNLVTAGYVKAESKKGYSFKIYLNNVYNANSAYREDKYVKLEVATYEYNQSNTGIIDFNKTDYLSQYRSVTLKVNYSNNISYVTLSDSSEETGAKELFEWLDQLLPNKIYFKATAIVGNLNSDRATGGANTKNAFIPSNQDTHKTSGYGEISRTFATSETGEEVNMIVRKQYSAPLISFRFDNVTSSTLIDSTGTQTLDGVISNKASSGDYAGMALNPYLYVSSDDYRTINAQGSESSNGGFEYIGLSNRTDTKYIVTFGYNNKTLSLTLNTSDINATLSGFASAVKENSARYDYDKNTAIYPYSTACLYEELYNWLKGDGDYHGGVLTTSIQVIAPTDSEMAGYWVSSETRECDNFAFFVRLDTVKTSFDPNNATFEIDNQYLASMYQKDRMYYYYQNNIPFGYEKISKNAKYRVVLTRPNTNEAGQETGEYFVYSYEILKGLSLDYSVCEWNATSTNNVGNLADILRIDRYATNVTQYSPNLNQWLLGSEWSINMYAYIDEDSSNKELITRGFNSETKTYSPKLKLVNDITNISVKINVNSTNNEVESLSMDNITVDSNVKDKFNASASQAVFTYNLGSGSTSTAVNIKQNVGASCYQDMVYVFINKVFINNTEKLVLGGKYTLKVRLGNQIENSVESEDSKEFTFEFYRQISARDFTASVSQVTTSDNYLTIKATVASEFNVTGMSATLVQTVLKTTSTSTTVFSNPQTLSGTNSSFSGKWNFDKNYADCFSTSSFTTTQATDLTKNGYVTSSNQGHIQAGFNTFYLYPVLKSNSTYNLMKNGTYISVSGKFMVPSSYKPSIELSSTESVEGGEYEYGEKELIGHRYYYDVYEKPKYYYVDTLKASVTNADGYEVNALWTYGWKAKSGETGCTKTAFSKSGKTSSLSTALSINLSSSGANYATYEVTLSAKSGFGAYFVTPSVTSRITPDLSEKHTERTFIMRAESTWGA